MYTTQAHQSGVKRLMSKFRNQSVNTTAMSLKFTYTCNLNNDGTLRLKRNGITTRRSKVISASRIKFRCHFIYAPHISPP